jgi:hypothetical protein
MIIVNVLKSAWTQLVPYRMLRRSSRRCNRYTQSSATPKSTIHPPFDSPCASSEIPVLWPMEHYGVQRPITAFLLRVYLFCVTLSERVPVPYADGKYMMRRAAWKTPKTLLAASLMSCTSSTGGCTALLMSMRLTPSQRTSGVQRRRRTSC